MKTIYKITERLLDMDDYDDAGHPYEEYSDDEYFFREEKAMTRVNEIVDRTLKKYENMRIVMDIENQYKRITNGHKRVEIFIDTVDVN